MSFLGFIYLFFYIIIFKQATIGYSVPPAFTDTNYFYDNVAQSVKLEYISVMDDIYNIFAWIDVFIDLDLVFGLLFLTLFFYGLKFASSIAKRIMGYFK